MQALSESASSTSPDVGGARNRHVPGRSRRRRHQGRTPGRRRAARRAARRRRRSRAFLALNRNKRSLALDIRHPRGREVIRDLVWRADVLIHNFRPGVAERLGYDYPALRALNERLVYAWLTAYGSEGPLAARPGYDLLLQGLAGILASAVPMACRSAPRLGRGPVGRWRWPMGSRWGFSRASARAGTARDDVSLHAALAMQLGDLVRVEHEMERAEAGPLLGPGRTRPTGAGTMVLVLVVVQDEQWRRLCRAIGRRTCRIRYATARPGRRARIYRASQRHLPPGIATRGRRWPRPTYPARSSRRPGARPA